MVAAITPAWFRLLLEGFDRIAIAGGPKTGKTTLSRYILDRPVIHTDDFIGRVHFADVPEVVNAQLEKEARWAVEGVQVGRCLRRGLPADAVLYLNEPLTILSKGQRGMLLGCRTIFDDWNKSHKEVPLVLIMEVPITKARLEDAR